MPPTRSAKKQPRGDDEPDDEPLIGDIVHRSSEHTVESEAALQAYAREWLYDSARASVPALHALLTKSLDESDLEAARGALTRAILRKQKPALVYISMDLGLRSDNGKDLGSQTKAILAKKLVEWVSSYDRYIGHTLMTLIAAAH